MGATEGTTGAQRRSTYEFGAVELRPAAGHDGFVTELRDFEAIDWHLYLNTPERRAAERIIRRLDRLIGVDIDTVSLDRYWKDPTLTDARLRSGFGPIVDPAEAIYAFMLTIARVTHRFSTSGPQTYERGAVEFIAVAEAGFVEPGVEWMEASIRNFEPSHS